MSAHAADARGRLANAHHAASQTPIVRLLGIRPEGTPEGFSAWAVGSLFGERHIVILPTLSTSAPQVIVDRLVARVLATATGTCPLCGRAAGLDVFSPAVVDVRHDEGCPAVFGPDDRRWFPSLEAPKEEGR